MLTFYEEIGYLAILLLLLLLFFDKRFLQAIYIYIHTYIYTPTHE